MDSDIPVNNNAFSSRHRMMVLSEILNDTPEDDDLGLLYAISEGFEKLREMKEEWKKEDAKQKSTMDREETDETKFQMFSSVDRMLGLDFNADAGSADELAEAQARSGVQLQRTNIVHAILGEKGEIEEKKEATDTEEEREIDGEGMYNTATAPTGWSLRTYLQGLSGAKEKKIVSYVAYIMCVAALIAGLVFIAQEYIEVRNNKSRTVMFKEAPSLSLPDILICNIATSFPPFIKTPKRYVGEPTTWIDNVMLPGEMGRLIKYPDTHKTVRLMAFNRHGQQCKPETLADPIVFAKEMQEPPNCFYCWHLGRFPEIVIKKSYGTMSEQTTHGNSLVVRVSRSRFVEKCRIAFATPSFGELRAFRSMILKHATKLEQHGILDFSGVKVKTQEDIDLVFPTFRRLTRDFVVRDVFDMYCNVYLFSGFFYPATNGDVRYKFVLAPSKRVGQWIRTGEGPYFPAEYEKWFQILTKRTNTNGTIGGEFKEFYVSRGDAVVSYTNTTETGHLQELAAQRPGSLAEVVIEKAVVKGTQVYSAHALNTDLKRVDTRGVDYVYLMKFGFGKFRTRIETDQVSMSTTRFLADFFGLISLFLDVSVYTMFVAPIMMKFKRRSQANAAALGRQPPS